MPRLEMMNPKTMPWGTPRTHLSGLSLTLFASFMDFAAISLWISSPIALRFSSLNRRRLFDGSGSGPNTQRVLGDIPRYAGHVRGTPREDVGARTEEVDEHCFLFGIEPGVDPDLLGDVATGVEGDGLNRLH
jgi:hypothetical protein